MWLYDKKLEYPIKIKKPDPKMAKSIITQYGGPDGELAASLRYLSQRFSMVTPEAKATLNDIGTEEMAHLEMIGTMVKQLTENASIEDIKKAGMDAYYSDHDKAIYPVSAAGVPFTAAYIQSKGDPMTDLYEDMAAEQKARSTYEYLINLADDPDVIEPLKFLREREIVHFQRFGESLRLVQDYLENKKRFSMPKTFGMNMPKLENANPMGMRDMSLPVMNMRPARTMPPPVPVMPPPAPAMPMQGPGMPPTAPSQPGLPIMPQTPVTPPMPPAGSMSMPRSSNMNMPGSMSMPGSTTMPGSMSMPSSMSMPGSMTMPESMSMPGSMTMPGSMNMPGNMNMPRNTNMHGNMNMGTEGMTMPGSSNMNMPGSMTMPGKKGMNMTMPGTMPGMPNMRDMQNVPGTPTMPRSTQPPRDMSTPPRRY